MNQVSKRILLVEDDTLISMSEATLLKNEGYRVDTASSGEEAIDKVNKGYEYDLILMDIDLGPGIDGTIAAERILNKHDIPVVFLSSHTETDYLERTDKITSYGHVVKNSSHTVLFTSIKMAFRLHEAHKKLLSREIMLEKSMKALEKSETFNRELLESLQIGILVLNDRGIIEYENRALKEMMGVPQNHPSPVVGKNFRGIKPLDDAGMLPFFSSLLEGNIMGATEFSYRSLYGKETEIEISGLPVFDTMGRLTRGVVLSRDISDRKRARAETEKYTSQLEFLSQKAMGFINLKSDEDIYVYIAQSLREILPDFRIIVAEYLDQNNFIIKALENFDNIFFEGIKILGRDPLGMEFSVRPELMHELFRQKVAYREAGLFETAGSALPLPITSLLDKLIDIGTIYAMGFSHQDVLYGHVVMFAPRGKKLEDYSLVEAFINQASVAIQKRRAEENLAASVKEKEILLLELQHRIKNSIAIIAGLIELEKGRFNETDIDNVLSNIRDRVSSIGALYELLYQRGDVKEIPLHLYINEMSKKLMSSYEYQKAPVTLNTSLDDIIFDVKRALPLGLIINEIITNSLKYAFPHHDNGQIFLTVTKQANMIKINISDNGIGLPDNILSGNSTGLGMDLIKMLVSQLNGKIKAKNKKGATYEISIPLSE